MINLSIEVIPMLALGLLLCTGDIHTETSPIKTVHEADDRHLLCLYAGGVCSIVFWVLLCDERLRCRARVVDICRKSTKRCRRLAQLKTQPKRPKGVDINPVPVTSYKIMIDGLIS